MDASSLGIRNCETVRQVLLGSWALGKQVRQQNNRAGTALGCYRKGMSILSEMKSEGMLSFLA